MRHLQLNEETSNQLREALNSFAEEAQLQFCALIAASGTVVEEVGNVPSPAYGAGGGRSAELAALAVGAYFATSELHARLGGQVFDGLYYDGSPLQVLLTPVTKDYVLLSCFGAETTAGIVRLCARPAGNTLAATMESALAEPEYFPGLSLPPSPEPVDFAAPSGAALAGFPPPLENADEGLISPVTEEDFANIFRRLADDTRNEGGPK